jgi:hypothetical protein
MAKRIVAQLEDEQRLSDDPRVLRMIDQATAGLRNKLAKANERTALAERELSEIDGISEFVKALGGDGGAVLPAFKPRKPSGTATGVICLNDWHGEERVEPQTINGLNEYSLEIAEQRIRNVASRTLHLLDAQRKLSNIKDLVVWIGGDIITGHIHEELAETSALSPTEACQWAKGQLIGLLDYWLEYADTKSITVVTSYGNHGRTTAKPRIATAAKHSFEWWMYHNLADIYQARGDKRIQFKVEQGYHNWLDVQGKLVRFHHGDWLKYNGGVGGITIPVNKSLNEWNKAKRADYDIFGHWHQHLKHYRWCACNCMIGYAPYALSIKAEWSEPSQTFIVFDRDRPVPVSVQEIYCV